VPRNKPAGNDSVRRKRTSLPPGVIRVVEVSAPNARQLRLLWTSTATIERIYPPLGTGLTRTGFGVGFNARDARAKAIGEALELYAARQSPEGELIHCSISDLTSEYIDPRELCLYSSSQYDHPNFPYRRFTARTRIPWTRGHWVDSGEAVWLPACLTYFGAWASQNQNLVEVTTNGLATGTSTSEAATRALLELVERDAFMITWLAKRPATHIVPDASLDRATQKLINKFKQRGLVPQFYLLHVGVDIPVVLCVVRGDGKDWPGATVGLGADANAATATRKAMLEQAFMGPALRREMLIGRFPIPSGANHVRTPLDHALYYVRPSRARALDFLDRTRLTVNLSSLHTGEPTSLESYVKTLSNAGAGIRVAIKDITPPTMAATTSLRVVRAVAPQLQPLCFGAGLTRSSCGRLQRLAPTGLNPKPHPLA
jgi:ribosomal protein S12 methylthiotransferase accessory factor